MNLVQLPLLIVWVATIFLKKKSLVWFFGSHVICAAVSIFEYIFFVCSLFSVVLLPSASRARKTFEVQNTISLNKPNNSLEESPSHNSVVEEQDKAREGLRCVDRLSQTGILWFM